MARIGISTSVLVLAMLAGPAVAQQMEFRASSPPPSPVEMRGALNAVIAQREAAMSLHIQAEIRSGSLAQQVETLQAKIKQLETKPSKDN